MQGRARNIRRNLIRDTRKEGSSENVRRAAHGPERVGGYKQSTALIFINCFGGWEEINYNDWTVYFVFKEHQICVDKVVCKVFNKLYKSIRKETVRI